MTVDFTFGLLGLDNIIVRGIVGGFLKQRATVVDCIETRVSFV